MNKSTFSLLDIKLLEPSTLISDICLGIACYLFYRILKSVAKSKFHRQYALYFLFMSLSAIIGGFAHALFLYTGKVLQWIGWIMTSFSMYYIETAIVSNIEEGKLKNRLLGFIKFKMIVLSLLTIVFTQFLFIKINISIGLLLIVSPILIFQYYIQGSKSNLYIVGGILLGMLPAFLHSIQYNFGNLISSNDFSHYFLIICQFFIFWGLKRQVETEYKTTEIY